MWGASGVSFECSSRQSLHYRLDQGRWEKRVAMGEPSGNA